ncbi:hypothetical protein PI124_g21989 [Phytophthora idaei]|nr:hypothetical protein PI126_g21602 [Phytophthora idaei]KAG3232934.1 hypothetical protein PI124_g21989 [Phytophthora idaei]
MAYKGKYAFNSVGVSLSGKYGIIFKRASYVKAPAPAAGPEMQQVSLEPKTHAPQDAYRSLTPLNSVLPAVSDTAWPSFRRS